MVAINKQLIYNSNRVSRMTKLKEKRLSLNLSCADMSKKLHISKTHYWQIEQKQRKLYYDMAFKIGLILNMKPDSLFYEDYH